MACHRSQSLRSDARPSFERGDAAPRAFPATSARRSRNPWLWWSAPDIGSSTLLLSVSFTHRGSPCARTTRRAPRATSRRRANARSEVVKVEMVHPDETPRARDAAGASARAVTGAQPEPVVRRSRTPPRYFPGTHAPKLAPTAVYDILPSRVPPLPCLGAFARSLRWDLTLACPRASRRDVQCGRRNSRRSQ